MGAAQGKGGEGPGKAVGEFLLRDDGGGDPAGHRGDLQSALEEGACL